MFVIEALRLERKGYESYTVVVDRADVATETERKVAVEKFKADGHSRIRETEGHWTFWRYNYRFPDGTWWTAAGLKKPWEC